jgi:prophage tail gpP-like protein
MGDTVELLIGGAIYAGWTDFRVTRSMDRAAGDFDLTVTERWPGRTEAWRILPFGEVDLRLGGDPVLKGYVDVVEPEIDAKQHRVRIRGRSKTCDLVDCTPELRGTEFRGATLPAIARALSQPFGIEVVTEAPEGAAFGVEAKEKTDTAWKTIERLGRLRGVVCHDDEQGRLVLTRAGERRAAGSLELGRNLLAVSARIDVSKRFSRYVSMTQRQTGAAVARDGDGDTDDAEEAEQPNAGVQVSVTGVATDPDVPRNRPKIFRAEGAGDTAFAQQRAVWAAATARAKSLQVEATALGWRKDDGALWRLNELVAIKADELRLDHDLLVIGTEFTLGEDGRRTRLTLTPKEALLPEPLRPARTGRRGAGGGSWNDAIAGSGRLP